MCERLRFRKVETQQVGDRTGHLAGPKGGARGGGPPENVSLLWCGLFAEKEKGRRRGRGGERGGEEGQEEVGAFSATAEGRSCWPLQDVE